MLKLLQSLFSRFATDPDLAVVRDSVGLADDASERMQGGSARMTAHTDSAELSPEVAALLAGFDQPPPAAPATQWQQQVVASRSAAQRSR